MYFIPVQSTLISIGFISKGAVFVGPICMYRLDGQKCHKKTADHELNFDRIYTTLRQLFTFQRSYFKTPLQTMS